MSAGICKSILWGQLKITPHPKGGSMKNKADYSKYRCPYDHIEKDCGHALTGPEGFQDTYSVWCACGFRGPVFCLDPVELKLEKIED